MRAGFSIKFLLAALLIITSTKLNAQLTVSNTLTAAQLVDSILVGNGVSASNITYSGSTLSIGKFSNGNTTNIGLDNGVLITTGSVFNAIGPNSVQNKTTNTLGGSDAQLASLVPGFSIFDAAVLEFDFTPISDSLKLEYVFASEEYPEWVGSSYNDVFGFFVSGPNPSGGTYSHYNLAVVPNSTNPVTVNNINNGSLNNGPCTNCAYYINNNNGTTIEYDGFTTVLRACLVVTPCVTYHIKIAIGDVGDHSYDSGIFLKSNSFSTNTVSVNATYSNPLLPSNCVEGCSDAIVSFTTERPVNYNRIIHYTIGGSAINGTDYTYIPDSAIIPAYSDSVAIVISPIADGIIEGMETVQLIVETSSCTHDTLDLNIDDYTAVNISISSPPTICIGDSATLSSVVSNGSVPFTYSWNTGDTTSAVTKKITSTSTYSVSVLDFCGFSDADTVTISIDSLPNIGINASQSSVCQGLSAQLTATGGNTYQWMPAAGLSNTTGSSVTASPTSTTTYIVVGTDNNGCKDSAQTILNILPLPNISATASVADICIGNSSTITSSGATNYNWSPNTGLNQTSGNIVIANPLTTTTYKVIGSISNGCTDSSNVTITVHNLPSVIINPANPSLCLGQSKTLIASGAQSYIWTPSTNLNTTTGSTVISSASSSTSYVVTGIDNWGCVNKDTVNLTVYNLPNVTVSPFDTSICDNSSLVITAGGAFSYSWTPSGSLSSSIGALVTASPNLTVTYTVIGTDIHGCTDTTTSHINVSTSPVVSPTNQTICVGNSATLSVTSNLTGTTFLWNNASTNANITVSPLATSNYSVTATDSNGCVGSGQATVTVNPLPNIILSPAAPNICMGTSVNLSAVGASTYSWSPSTGLSSTSGSSVTANPTLTTTYMVVGQSSSGCYDTAYVTVTVNPTANVSINHEDTIVCIGSTFSLTASGASTYSWTPSTYLSATNTATVSVTPTSNINYVVTGTDANGCVGQDSAHIIVSPILNTAANLPRICIGDSANLSVSSNLAATYLWSTGSTLSSFYVKPIATTSYSVTATDTIGCTASSTVTVVVDTQPVVMVAPVNPDLCNGTTVTLTATGAVTYSWYPATSLSGTTGNSVNANPTSNITYSVIGTSSTGCKDTAHTNINVIPSPTVTVTPDYDTLCQGFSTSLTSAGAITYSWSPSTGLSTTSGNNVTATPNISTNYQEVGTSANGCTGTATDHIYINAKPIISVSPDSVDICLGRSVLLTASGATNLLWSPAASLSSSTTSSVLANPVNTTIYTIIGTTAAGCKDTTTAYVGVHAYPVLTLTPMNPHMCPSDSITFITSGATNYIWSPTSGLSSSTNDTVIAKPTQNTTYQVIGSDIYGCKDTISSTLSVSPLPIISPSNPAICINDSVRLTVTSNTASSTFLWSTTSTSDTIWVSPNITTKYYVTATDNSMCSQVDSVEVTVNAIPALAVSPTNPGICPGDSITITASGADSYNWSPSSSLSTGSGISVDAFPTSTTSYSVIGSTLAGCKDTLLFQVVVYGLPTISVTPTAATFCGGLSQTLIASGGISYSWSPSTGLNSTTNDTVLATPAISTIYYVVGQDTNGCQDTATATLSVYSDPIISPATSTICLGDTATLTATTIVAPNSFLWSNGSAISSIQVNPTVNTTYTITATYPGGCIKTASASVSIYNDPVVSAGTQDYSVCPHDTITLYASNSVSYSWTPINSLLQTTGVHVNAVPSSATIYTVEGTSSHGCKTTDTVNIFVFPQPNVSASVSPLLVCRGDTALLFGIGAQNYQWSPSNGLIGNNTSSIFTTPDSTETYYLRGIDTNGCIDYDTVSLIIDQGPTVSITPLHPVLCQGDTTILTGHGAVTYQWFPTLWLNGSNSQTAQIFPSSNITYKVTGYDSNGCSSDSTVYVNVKRNPVIWVFPPLDSICLGDSVKICAIGAGGNGTYNWAPSSGLSTTVGDTIFASPTVNTTYKITGISTDGCAKSISSTIKVHPKPIMNITANPQTICKNDSVIISASGADNYSWSPLSSTYANWGDSIGIQPPVSSTIKVVGSTIFGCSDSITTQVIVNQLPNIVATATDSSLCIGDSTTLNAGGAATYLWNSNPALNQTSGASVKAIPTATSTFVVEGTDVHGCKNIDSIDIVINPRPTIGIQPSAWVVCEGNPVQLQGQSNVNPTTFIWSTGDTVNMLTSYPTTTTTYQVNGFNIYGCDDSAFISIQANPFPQLSINYADTLICDYDSVSLMGVSTINPVNFLWSTNATTSSITVSPNANTTYSLIASDSIGCSDTIYSTVRIQPIPAVAVSSSKNPSCAGDSIVLSSVASGTVTSYLWSNMVVMPSMNIYPTTSGVYSLLVTDSIGCHNLDTLYQQVNPLPQMSITSTANQICIGDTVSLSATSTVNPVNYLWSTNSTNTGISVNPSTTTTYTVTGTDSIGCLGSASKPIIVHNLPLISFLPVNAEICNGDSVVLTANSTPTPAFYLWSDGCVSQSNAVGPSNSTVYSVEITDIYGCKDTANKLVVVHPIPIVNVSPNYTGICSGDTVLLTANSNHPIQTVTWSTNQITQSIQVHPMMTHQYWAEVTDTNNCSSVDTASIVVVPRPSCTITAVDDTICSVDSTTILYSGNGSKVAQYHWNFDSGINLSGSGKDPHWVKWNHTGFKTVRLTVTENGCTSYPDTAGVMVYQTPIIDFVAMPTEACESLLVNFENRTPNLKSYQWNFGNPLDNKDTSSLQNPAYAYPYAGSYTIGLYGISNEGCPAYGYKVGYVNVHENPLADFGAYPNQTLITKPNVSFWDFSNDAKYWYYNFDDPKSGINNTSTYDYPWHEFKDTGIFNVSLVVINQYGCSDTAWRQVHIKPFAQVYFPNAFSPNGDGINDVFEIKGHDFDWSTYEFHVFNRWGQIVFETTDINEGWDGKMMNTNELCPVGIYTFIVRVKDKDLNKAVYRGNIMLIQ